MADSWAVKYRPQNFTDVVGNSKQALILREAVKRHQEPPAVFLAGTRGSGKCISKDTLLLTAKGIQYAKDVFPGGEWEPDTFIEYNCDLVNMNGELEETSHAYYNGVRDCIHIKSFHGYSLVCTPNHPLYVFNGTGFEWKQAKDITTDDFLTTPQKLGIYGDFENYDIDFVYHKRQHDSSNRVVTIPKRMTVELAEFLGMLVGDCALLSGSRGAFSYSIDTAVYPDLEKVFKSHLKSLFNIDCSVVLDYRYKSKQNLDKHKLMTYRFSSVVLKSFLQYIGLEITQSVNKQVPYSILQSGKEIQQAFLRGLFETDGWITTKYTEIGYASASEKLVRQVQLMLLNMGIQTHFRCRYNKEYDRNYFYLSLLDVTARERYREIGFISEEKKGRLRVMRNPIAVEPRICIKNDLRLYNVIYAQSKLRAVNKKDLKDRTVKRYIYGGATPNFSGLSDNRITRILECDNTLNGDLRSLLQSVRDDFYLDRVSLIETVSNVETVDFTLPETHSFITNGLVSHNTTCARIYAKAMCCEHPTPDGEPCNECDSCKDIMNGSYPDVIEIDAASENSVQGIRDLIKTLNYLPTRGDKKIVILDEIHCLSQAANNAMLKTLEEPSEFIRFIFCTTEPQKVLETIRSRCLMFRFNDITARDIESRLKFISQNENVLIDDAALNAIARNSNGGMRDAIMLLEQAHLANVDNSTIKPSNILELVGSVSVRDIQKLFMSIKSGDQQQLLEWLDEEKFSPIDILNSSISFLETVVLIKQGVSPAEFVSKDLVSGVMSLASTISFHDVSVMFEEFKGIIYDLRSLNGVSSAAIFRLRLLGLVDKLTYQGVPASGGVPVQQLSFLQMVKAEFNPERIPLPV